MGSLVGRPLSMLSVLLSASVLQALPGNAQEL